MATKQNNIVAKKDGWEPKGFANLTLTQEQIKHAFTTFDSPEKVEHVWLKEMEDEYKFTFSYNPKTNAIVCSCTSKDANNPNSGWILTSHAPTWFEALSLTLYKHTIVLERNWGDSETKASASQYG